MERSNLSRTSRERPAALTLSAEASGAVRKVHTTVLMTVAEAMVAMKAAQTDQYKPPS